MATDNQSSPVNHYVDYLPAILQADPFVGQLLQAFERVMSGLSPRDNRDEIPKGLEEYIDSIHTYFNPGIQSGSDTAPSEFLPWLASWVALSLRDEWEEKTKRQFISKIVPLYRKRGTKAGLEEILKLYLKSSQLSEKVEVYEFDDPPYYFQVQLTLPDADQEKYWRQARIAKAIIDQEKPAHTYYALKILVPTMRLTGQFYPVRLEQKGKITAIVEQEANDVLVLTIKGSPARAEPYKREIGRKTVSISYEVTQEEFAANQNWRVTVANLSDKTVAGKITITVAYPDNIPSSVCNKFTLSPGLKIGRHPNGNTLLGTKDKTI